MYQVKHKVLGVYQGKSDNGMMFWHPISDTPELGFFSFETESDANVFVLNLANYNGTFKINTNDLSIENFDVKTSKRLKTLGEYINKQLKSGAPISKKAGYA